MNSVYISGLACSCGLGADLSACMQAMQQQRTNFQTLGEIYPQYADAAWAAVAASILSNRGSYSQRKYAPASNLALALARACLADSGAELSGLGRMAVVVGSSRGNAAGWLDGWEQRRPISLMAASNSLHSELGACITIELGITGPYHILANGCSAGLDAIGFAALLIKNNMVDSALALGVDLPIIPRLLDTYAKTGMLSQNGLNNPYHEQSSGLLPGEGGACMLLTKQPLEQAKGREQLAVLDWQVNSDADSPLGLPENGAPIAALLNAGLAGMSKQELQRGVVLCPHASGTRNNALGETAAWREVLQHNPHMQGLSIHALKPFVGHAIGASGAIETVLMCAWMRDGLLPANLSGLHVPDIAADFPMEPQPLQARQMLKSASSMGGHNSCVRIASV